jgi:hypothetical protein
MTFFLLEILGSSRYFDILLLPFEINFPKYRDSDPLME